MPKSGVNIRRLAQNIADQYPFEPEVATLIELVANALDAKARVIDIQISDAILRVTDDGVGMTRKQFKEYHDFATTTKERGAGIGFAGQGAKLALNFCDRIISETRSKNYHDATIWRLEGDDAPYRYIDERTLSGTGTRVSLYLEKDRKSFYTPTLVKQILEDHYFPLLDPQLVQVYTGDRPLLKGGRGRLEVYREQYRKGLKFVVNASVITSGPIETTLNHRKEFSILRYKKPQGWGFFGLAEEVLPEHLQGVAVTTYGKVIERTWFKKEPRHKDRIFGWIEAPYLIKAVTTDKCRFQRGNKNWEGFFRRAQKEFAIWLEGAGLLEKREPRPLVFPELEREINRILKQIPSLTFFGARRVARAAIPDESGEERSLGSGTQKAPGTEGGPGTGEGIDVYPGPEEGVAPTVEPGEGRRAEVHRRVIRGGIRLGFEERADLSNEGWFDGETIVINTAHPAYVRSSRAREAANYHVLKTTAVELTRFSMDHDPEPSCQKAFDLMGQVFTLWGEQQ